MLSIFDEVEKPIGAGGASTVSVRAAITGASCRLPGAENLNAFWELIKSRRHGLRHSPKGRYEALELSPQYIESLEEIGHQWGGFIDNPEMFDPVVFGMSRAEASATDPQHRLLMEVVWEALENACEAPDRLAGSRTGVFVGLSSFDYAMFLSAFDPYGALVTPFSSAGAVHSIAANRISYMLDLRGPSIAIDSACSSSSYALHMALQSLQNGACDAAIVCGANMIMTPYITKSFKRARMLAKDGVVKSFDENADGYVRSEGAVAFVIRREEDATSRGNRIMGVISGSSVNHDGKTAGLVAPSSERQVELIHAAHEAAGVDQSQIGFVEAHGTGTFRGDETELKALNEVFEDEQGNAHEKAPCYVGSVKSNVGHLESVSGLAGLLKTVLCLENEEIPGQANLNKPMPEADVDGSRVVVTPKSTAWTRGKSPRRAGVSCHGFGGANSHIILEEAPARNETENSADRPVHVLKLSAKKPEQLARMATKLRDAVEGHPEHTLGDICYSANAGRADFEERAIIVTRSYDDLCASLSALADERNENGLGDTIVRGRANRKARKIAFLLADEVSNQFGVTSGLYRSEPRFAALINDIDEQVEKIARVKIGDFLSRDDFTANASMDDPVNARVALFVIQFALARFLSDLGIAPSFVVSGGAGDTLNKVLERSLSFEDGLKAVLSRQIEDADGSFKDSLEAALEAGADLLIEFGQPSALVADVVSELDTERDVIVTSGFATVEDDCASWAKAIATIYTCGVNVDWQAYDAPFARKSLVLPTYVFDRERFWFSDDASMPGTILDQANSTDEAPRANVVEVSVVSPASESNGSKAPGVRATMSRAELFEFVRDCLAAATLIPKDEIKEDTCFLDVELDSIAGLELLLRIDKNLGVMPDPEMFAEDMTFGAAIDALHEIVLESQGKRGNGVEVVPKIEIPKPKNASLETNVTSCAKSKPQENLLNGHALNGHKVNGQALNSNCSTSERELAVMATSSLLDEIKDQIDPTDYLKTVRPDFTMAMHEMLLDVDFDTARGDHVSGSRFGESVRAIDMLGGFGSTLFGHNHPALVAILKDALSANRPKFMQMSNRSAAGTLAKEIVARVTKLTGRDYKAVLGSTGAEMVDAALKHALFEWSLRREQFVSACRSDDQKLPDALHQQPVVLAIEGSYHGKTMGAYSLTWNAPGRDDLGLQGPFEVVWLPRDDEDAAAEIFERYQSEIDTGDGSARFNRIAGLFLEPVQGEGGIFPLAKSFVAGLRALADDAGCPIVVDEIQSGMGRTGAFAAASLIGLRGDYYLFGKSLGGGLSKTSALLIDSERYAEGYGFAHTSTFGEDDHGALVGLRALRLLDEDNVEERSVEAGEYLVERLREVKTRYPNVISDVRGCGLMVGIELASQTRNESQLISGLSDQKLLGIFFASHLLHRCGVRVGTALSRPSTIRFEPSAYISRADMDFTAKGIEAVCALIHEGNAGEFVRHLAQGYRMSGQTPFQMKDHPAAGQKEVQAACSVSSSKNAVFLGHMIDSEDIGLLDKSLLSLSESERENLAERLVDPVLVKRVPMMTSCGDSLNFELHTLPLTSRAIVNALREGESAKIVEQVNCAVARFAEGGARVVGLGGLLSVITRNGLAVQNDFKDLQITTGNTYTVALAAEAVMRTVSEQHMDSSCERVGLIGAGGNIGSTLAHIFSEHFHCLRLVGRKATIARVEQVADTIYDLALAGMQAKERHSLTGLAAALADSKVLSLDDLGHVPARNGSALNGDGRSAGAKARQKIIEHYGEDPFLPVSTSIEALKDCSIVVTASNSIAPILTASNVGSATRIICDVSVPSDVDPELSVLRPDITIIRGGVAKAPDNNSFKFDMIDLPQNHMLACMTETALLGFSGKQGFRTIGDIHASGVRECHELGNRYGFGLGYFSLDKPFAVELA